LAEWAIGMGECRQVGRWQNKLNRQSPVCAVHTSIFFVIDGGAPDPAA
jgi:hypothetical protein